VVGAAGLVALDHLPRLPDDHARARRLADGLAALGFALTPPETNVVRVPVPDAARAVAALRAAGVLAVPLGATAIRFVMHRDLGDADVGDALARVATVAEGILAGGRL
jgi:threonine aldolase